MSAFVDQQRAAGFAVELVCRTLGVSASAYYARKTDAVRAHEPLDAAAPDRFAIGRRRRARSKISACSG